MNFTLKKFKPNPNNKAYNLITRRKSPIKVISISNQIYYSTYDILYTPQKLITKMSSEITTISSNKILAVGDKSGNLKLISNDTILRKNNFGFQINRIYFSKDHLLFCGKDKNIRYYDYVNNVLNSLEYHEKNLLDISVHNDLLYSSSEDYFLKVYDFRSQNVVVSKKFNFFIKKLNVFDDKNLILGDCETIYNYDLRNMKYIYKTANHQDIQIGKKKIFFNDRNELISMNMNFENENVVEFADEICSFSINENKVAIGLYNGQIYANTKNFDKVDDNEVKDDKESIFFKEKMPDVNVIENNYQKKSKLEKMISNYEFRGALNMIIEEYTDINDEEKIDILRQVYDFYSKNKYWNQILKDKKLSHKLFNFFIKNFYLDLKISISLLILIVRDYEFEELKLLKEVIDREEEYQGMAIETIGYIETMMKNTKKHEASN